MLNWQLSRHYFVPTTCDNSTALLFCLKSWAKGSKFCYNTEKVYKWIVKLHKMHNDAVSFLQLAPFNRQSFDKKSQTWQLFITRHDSCLSPDMTSCLSPDMTSCLSPDMTDLPWVEWVFYRGILYTLSPRSYSCIYKWTRYSGTLPLASPQTTWTGNQSTNNKVTVLSYRYRMDVTLKSLRLECLCKFKNKPFFYF